MDIEEQAKIMVRAMQLQQDANARVGAGFGDVIKALQSPAKLFEMTLTGLTGVFSSAIKSWQYASDSGAYISKNFVEFGTSLFQAQLSQDDLSRIVNRTGVNFQTLGGSMEGSTRNLLALSNAYSRNAEAQNYFKDLGYTVEQTNEVIASTAASTGTFNKAMKGTPAEQAKAMESVIAKSKDLAAEMAALTDVTGISRKKQLEEREDQDRDIALQTALEDLPEAQRNGFKNITADLQAAGLEKIGRAIFTSEGALSEKEGQFLSLMGNAGPAFERAVLDYKEALRTNDDATIKAAKIRVDQARDEVVQVANTPEFKAMVKARTQMGEYTDDILKLRGATLQLNRAMQEHPGMSSTEALAASKKAQESKDTNTSGNEYSSATQKLSQTLLGIETIYNQRIPIEADILKVAAKIAGDFTNLQVGTNKETIKDIITSGKINAEAAKDILATTFSGILDGLHRISEKGWKDLATDAEKGFKEFSTTVLNEFKTLTQAVQKNINYREVPPVQRAGGSPGIADFLSSSSNMMSVFENFGSGTPAVLHGMESVIRPEQLNGIINKAAGTAMSSLSGSMQTATSQFSQINPEVFNDIKSQLAMLNNLMASHLPDISSSMTKQYSALRDLSPDFHA
jgi:hypothetical protein